MEHRDKNEERYPQIYILLCKTEPTVELRMLRCSEALREVSLLLSLTLCMLLELLQHMLLLVGVYSGPQHDISSCGSYGRPATSSPQQIADEEATLPPQHCCSYASCSTPEGEQA